MRIPHLELTLRALLLLIVAAGFVYSLSLGETLLFPDEGEFRDLAASLREGSYSLNGHPTAYRPPAYPLLLALLSFVSDSVVFARVVNFILLAATLGVLFRLVARETSHAAGLAAAMIAAAFPVFFFGAGLVLAQTLTLLLYVLATERTFHGKLHARGAVVVGCLHGVMALATPFMFLISAFQVVWMVGTRRWRPTIAIWFLAGVGACLSPWVARNAGEFGTFIPLSTNGGVVFLAGNVAGATGASGGHVDLSEFHARTRGMSEPEADRYRTRAAWDSICQNPGASARLYATKLANFFHFTNSMHGAGLRSVVRDGAMLLIYGPLLALFLLRFLLVRRIPPSDLEWFLMAQYVAAALIMAVFFTRIRLRAPFDLLMIALVAIFVARWHDSRRSAAAARSASTSAPAGGVT